MTNVEQVDPGKSVLSRDEIDLILGAGLRGLCVATPEGLCRYVSSNLAVMLGYSREELIGLPVHQFLQGLPPNLAHRPRHSPEFHDLRLARPEGSTLYARVEIRDLVIHGERTGLAIFVKDLAEEKQVEEVLRKTEKLAAAGRMAAAIAHEINNPLEAITNILYLLRTEDLDQNALRLVSLADSEIERVSRIARQTLSFYRESGTPVRLDLRELLNMSVDVHAIRSPGLRVHRRYRTNQQISGYASELQQVFHNIVANSVDAGATDLWLHLNPATESLPPQRAGIRVTIADNGSGIEPSVRTRLFDPFITTKGEGGTGLGLWVTRGIVLRHEGAIRVRTSTRPGRSGTCFNIFLPR